MKINNTEKGDPLPYQALEEEASWRTVVVFWNAEI